MTPIPPDARALTIRQPWASLIALGIKTIETRGFRTDYRGPLVIHAGARAARLHEAQAGWDRLALPFDDLVATLCPARDRGADPLPLGAVVAVVDLVDVVPIVDMPKYEVDTRLTNPAVDRPYATLPPTYICGNERVEGPALWLVENGGRYISQTPFSVTDQLPFGDFTPGRYAWLLDNVRPVDPADPGEGSARAVEVGGMTPPTHIIHIGFFEEGTEERVGAVDHAVPPRVGEVVWLGARAWEVVAQWSYTHPDSPAARDGQMGGLVDVLVRPGRGLFR